MSQRIQRYQMPIFGLAFLLVAALLSACDTKQKTGVLFNGQTMGTQWHAALVELPEGKEQAVIQADIEQLLVTVNDQMSTWQEDSELSRFNQYQNTDWFEVSADLVEVVDAAKQLSEQSQGVFDVTIGPLVNLWGFGAGRTSLDEQVPDEVAIQLVLQQLGYQQLQTQTNPPALKKTSPKLYVDLSAIAKGYGVDVVGRYFESLGIQNYLVEVGGEIRTRGKSPRGDQWRIAIEKPVDQGRAVQQGVALDNASLATSGDYRNFFIKGGKRYSHTLDITTGYPVKHSLASVSVLAKSTMLADGYATMLMAMGEVKGKAFADQHDLAAYFIWRTDDGFETYVTPSFEKSLLELK